MENLIVIEGKEKYQYNDIKSLIENFINKNYFDMSKEERKIELEKKTIGKRWIKPRIETSSNILYKLDRT